MQSRGQIQEAETLLMNEYWRVCVEAVLDDAGLTYTPEQLQSVTAGIIGCRENESTGCGYDVIGNPGESVEIRKLQDRIRNLEKALSDEQSLREKVIEVNLDLRPDAYWVNGDGYLERK
jgi:hypothetical protein